MGGDEFVVLLPRVRDVSEATAVAERVLAALRTGIDVTASIGIATYPLDGDDAEALLRSADTAMYVAKSHGGNSYQMAATLQAMPATPQQQAS